MSPLLLHLRLVLVLLSAFALSACGGDDGETETAAAATSASSTGCREVEQPAAREPASLEPPTAVLNVALRHTAVVKTNCGEFQITLDQKTSPKAVASFVALADDGYFDGTFFHRIVPGFVIQGGDPTGKGSGGPGYSTVDTPPAGTTYTTGVVAMAKTAAEPRGTAGSQFFVMTANATLPPDYAVIGKVTKGLDVVQRIGLLGDPATELPTQPVVIDSITVTRSGP